MERDPQGTTSDSSQAQEDAKYGALALVRNADEAYDAGDLPSMVASARAAWALLNAAGIADRYSAVWSPIAERCFYAELPADTIWFGERTLPSLLTSDEPTKLIQFLTMLSHSYRDLGDHDRAESLVKQVEPLARRHLPDRMVANLLIFASSLYLARDEPARALTHAMEAMDIEERVGSKKGLARATGLAGVAFGRLGIVDAAIRYHDDTISIHQELGDQMDLAIEAMVAGTLLLDHEQYSRALGYFEVAFPILRAEVGGQPMLDCLECSARCLNQLDRQAEAMALYAEALETLG